LALFFEGQLITSLTCDDINQMLLLRHKIYNHLKSGIGLTAGPALETTLLFNMSDDRVSETGVRASANILLESAPRLDFTYQMGINERLDLKEPLIVRGDYRLLSFNENST